MKIVIRKAREDELKIVQELNQQLFEHDQPFDETLKMDWPYSEEGIKFFSDRISGKGGVCFVAEVDGEVVGYLAGQVCWSEPYRSVTRTELENTLVREDYRGQKIGEKLFEEFIKWSSQQKVQRIKVSAYAGNERAIKFYQRVGFRPYALELEYELND